MAVVNDVIMPDPLCWRSIGNDPCSQNGKMEGFFGKRMIPIREFLTELARRVGSYIIDIPGRHLEYVPGQPRGRAA